MTDLADFDFPLPADRIAAEPAERRDEARLLVLPREGEEVVGDARVRDLPELLEPGDLLVVNDTRVVPARLFGRRQTGGRVEVLLLERTPDGGRTALVRASKSLRPGEILEMDGALRVTLVGRRPAAAVWRVRLTAVEEDGREHDETEVLASRLDRHGHMPLPPYIRRPDRPADRERYQTMFAARSGSAAAPTAGLHFTPELVVALARRGIGLCRITLHVGYGTFQPVQTERIEDHRMHSEEFEVTEEAATAIRERKGRLVAVGTTTARVLETLARTGGVRAARGRTDLYLYPGTPFLEVQGLLTNFHLPKSSLLLLVCAFAGRDRVLGAYRHAVETGYRFYSYGDAMLVL